MRNGLEVTRIVEMRKRVSPRSITENNGLKNPPGALQSSLSIFEEREPSNMMGPYCTLMRSELLDRDYSSTGRAEEKQSGAVHPVLQ
jgi:hypothetical protein